MGGGDPIASIGSHRIWTALPRMGDLLEMTPGSAKCDNILATSF
jgi:hypothetical protein